ncbi:unnamed protein product [Rhizoctonia solani]|uniref:Ricin B lectin domain-containing protein n=1 Tax=Rhizoctonia solani TaxID=456999 RepID=A0A8H3BIE6_9AGAM|nr:unnamed protein product [Rhizoctonia solani]
MTIIPGTYTIRDADSGRVIDYHCGPNWIGTGEHHGGDNQKWRIKPYLSSSGYAIQNVMTSKYIPMKPDRAYMSGVDEGDAAILDFEHQFQGFYLNDAGSTLQPRSNLPVPISAVSQSNTSSQSLRSLYTDDAHLYTDMLFNMPRVPFTRDQRVAALDWARKLGATNVPTIESFDECERRFEVTLENNNNTWYVKCYPGSSKYAIQDTSYKKYIAVAMNGNNPYGVEEEDASVLELEHQFQNFYLIKLAGTNKYLEHPNVKLEHNHTMTNFTDRVPLQGCSWRFERISGDTGSALKPKPNGSVYIPTTTQLSVSSSQGLNNLCTNDTHLYTDMLFNMHRAPFTRIQRIATLDWARKLGATNAPTIESFDEYEKQLEATMGSVNNVNQD